jgi:hypothetical protein
LAGKLAAIYETNMKLNVGKKSEKTNKNPTEIK